MASRNDELRDVLKTLQDPPQRSSRHDEDRHPPGDKALLLTWGGCLLSTLGSLVFGYTSFVEQDSSPKQIAAIAYTAFGMGASYVIARCVHELILASRRKPPLND